jgi:hypothetical protein
MVHGAYNPDQAPSHSFVFTYLKKLIEYEIPDLKGVKCGIGRIFAEIGQGTRTTALKYGSNNVRNWTMRK